MNWPLYGVIAILVILLFIMKKSEPTDAQAGKKGSLPYKKRDDFLSMSELSFYRTMGVFLQNKAVICPKVAVNEVVFVGSGVGKERTKFLNWINRKHVDFVLCDAGTMQVVCAVELDDKSHQNDARKERDAFVDRVFETAKVPLFHIPAKRGYSAEDFTFIINCFSNQATTAAEVPNQPATETETSRTNDNAPLCPKCGIPMIKRKALQGTKAGREFYGCSNFPKCREVKQI